MDACQHDAPMAQPERRFAALERRLAEVEADNRRLRADNVRLQAEVRRLTERLAPYEPAIRDETPSGHSVSTPPSASDYSLEGERKRRQRRQRRRKKQSPGRRPTEIKFADAQRYEDIYPEGIRRCDCTLA